MAILKKRPRISLLAPRELVAGTSFEVEVKLQCDAPVPVDALEVEFEARRGYLYDHDPRATSLWAARARPFRGGDLGPGEHSYRVRFDLPSDLPSSFRGDLVFVDHRIHVRADIPWWPDATATFMLYLVGVQQESSEEANVYATHRDGPPGTKPYFEVALGRSQVKPGGQIAGAISLANVDHNDYREIEVRLLAEETVNSGLVTDVRYTPRTRWIMEPRELRSDVPVRFWLNAPATMPPAFQSGDIAMRWLLEIRVHVAWGPDATTLIPVTVEASSPPGDNWDAPLAVGSERMALVWRQVAERVGATLEGDRLVGSVGDAVFEVRREHRGRRGVGLSGELRFENLGVGLSTDRDGWSARDSAHEEALRSALGQLDGVRPHEAGDEHLAWEVDDAGLRVQLLFEFVQTIARVGRVLLQVFETLGPPARLAADAPDWEEAATRLRGRFVAARCGVVGVRQHARFALYPEWGSGGSVHGWVVEVVPDAPLDPARRFLWSVGDPVPTGPGFDLTALVTVAQSLVVDGASMRARFPSSLGGMDAVGHVEHLLALERVFGGQSGPYR